jgi:hypothetical protein
MVLQMVKMRMGKKVKRRRKRMMLRLNQMQTGRKLR